MSIPTHDLHVFQKPHAVPLPFLDRFQKLDELLATRSPVGALELLARFRVPVRARWRGAVGRIGDAIWLTVGGEEKLLPSAVVNDLLAKKLAEMEERKAASWRPHAQAHEGRPRPRTAAARFRRPSRTDALVDLAHGVCAVDTSSRKNGEAVVSEIRHAMGSFPALPLNAEVAPRNVLTGWIAGDPLPDGVSLGEECELKDPMDGGAVVKCQHQDLQGDEIAKHLEVGKQVTRLALPLDDHVSFVLGEDLVVRKFKLLDGAVDQLESTEREDLRAELDARFALMSAEFSRLFMVLEKALKLSKADG